MNSVFSENLRRLRQAKGYTQEQAADRLGVSPQSVSRWECGNTLPDVMLLPEIARLYGTTVDDLYREQAQGYANYAQRLLAVYESSGQTQDFLAAEQEFFRIPSDKLTADDLRCWGVLYHYMTNHCAVMSQQKLESAIAHPTSSDDVFCSAAQQKIALMRDLGREREEVSYYDAMLERNPNDPHAWLLCTAAHNFAGENEVSLEIALKGIQRFSDYAILYSYAGDILQELGRSGEAFPYWEKALTLKPTLLAAAYSICFCHEELKQYAEACKAWEALSNTLTRLGYTIEAEESRKNAEKCRSKVSANK